ncbi:NAD-dependent epimerase/dehydratase family protein [Rhodocyclus tenuis]|uniref:NAD-dependent epimerase/dehydratase family protein n=1 Tax=Rhodocyclus gracilis TaxID=2929842 RepID=UPI001298C30E|nr:NAD-dependent epimerase/dehydratase family protein [Rhodocyclus gracilis]MRD73046.1 NAD-dependent epimerase/dehydratase family protein [Rhodocyclus gracilis]
MPRSSATSGLEDAAAVRRRDLDEVLQRGAADWASLRGASIFMSGGTGWFGRCLLEAVAAANAQLDAQIRVTVLTRNAAAFARQAPTLAAARFLHMHEGDVRDFAFPATTFSHVIHAATTSARETFLGETPLAKFDTLVRGSRRVLDFAAHCGARHVLFTSSGAAYGSPDSSLIGEALTSAPDTTATSSALGEGKRAAEFLFAAYAEQHDWQCSIARCFSFVGPHMPLDLHYAIGDFIRQALQQKRIVVHGDGLAVRSYLYTADLVVWLVRLLQRNGPCRVFNVGSDQGISIGELAQLVGEQLNPGGDVEIAGRQDYSVGNPVRRCYVPDIARARTECGVRVWTPLPEAIRRTAALARDAIDR